MSKLPESSVLAAAIRGIKDAGLAGKECWALHKFAVQTFIDGTSA